MIFFRYTRALEARVEELKGEKRELQARIDKLTEALVPVLQRMTREERSPVTAGDIVKPKQEHKITRSSDQTSATCLCGWNVEGNDPAELQEAISAHYKSYLKPLTPGRSGWLQARDMAEALSEAQFVPRKEQS